MSVTHLVFTSECGGDCCGHYESDEDSWFDLDEVNLCGVCQHMVLKTESEWNKHAQRDVCDDCRRL